MAIIQVEPDSSLLEQVIALADRNRATLGFLPAQGFRERAEDGMLLADIDELGGLRGYVLHDLPRNEVHIIQLCVHDAHRGQCAARRLVDELPARYPSRRGAYLKCRNDFPAHNVWPRLGFVPLREGPGRSYAGLPLTLWWRDFGLPNLFNWRPPVEDKLFAALDTSVFFDLEGGREGSAESQALRADWVQELVEFVLTDEILQDIRTGSEATRREHQRRRAARFHQFIQRPEVWQPLYASLLSRLQSVVRTEQDRSDLRHLAKASAARIPYFVSRDQDLIEKFGPTALEVCHVKAVRPSDLVRELDERRRAGDYQPVQLANTNLFQRRVRSGEADRLAELVLNTPDGERLHDLRHCLRDLLSQPEEWECDAVGDGDELLGVVAARRAQHYLEVALLRVAPSGIRTTLARQLVYQQRARALDLGLRAVRVTDPRPLRAVRDALIAEEFAETPNGWESLNLPHCVASRDVAALLQAELIPVTSQDLSAILQLLEKGDELPQERVVELESRFWPLKISDADLPSYLVPIKAPYAEALFDVSLSKQTLFHRPRGLSLSREHVYYRKPSNSGGLAAPARILWYVSDERGRPGTMAIRACSRLEEVVVGRPRSLHRRYHRLGAYRLDDVLGCADRIGQAMALRFVDTELFHQPVPLSDLRELAVQLSDIVVLQSPRCVLPQLFTEIYRAGSGLGCQV